MKTISHEIRASSSATAAYEALTTPKGVRSWWAKDCDIASDVGGEQVLRFDKDGRKVTMRFRVDALQPNRRVAWTCTANDNPVWIGTNLSWDIDTHGDEVTVRFAHRGFAEDQSPPYRMTEQGWAHFRASLQSFLATGRGQPW